MRNRNILLTIAGLSLFTFACKSHDENAFTITGQIKNAGAATKVELEQIDSTEFIVADTSKINADGKFNLKASTPYPSLFRLKVGESTYDVIAKNGDEIELTATAGTEGYDVTGAEEVDQMKEFTTLSSSFTEKNTKLSTEYDQKSKEAGVKSDSLLNYYRGIFMNNIREYNKQMITFINKNTNSLTAFYAASSVDPREFEQPLIAYAETIKDKFTDNPTVQRFVKQMIALKPVSVGQKAQDFSITGLDGKTINLSDYKGNT